MSSVTFEAANPVVWALGGCDCSYGGESHTGCALLSKNSCCFRGNLIISGEMLRFFANRVESSTLRVTSFTLRVTSFAVRAETFTVRVEAFTVRVKSFTLRVEDFTVRV